MLIFINILSSILAAMICYQYAPERGRNQKLWLYGGFIFGIYAVIALFILPKEEIQKDTTSNSPNAYSADRHSTEDAEPRFQDWYFIDKRHEKQGPVPFRRLLTAWRDQLISKNSFVWSAGMNEWESIENLPHLLEELD